MYLTLILSNGIYNLQVLSNNIALIYQERVIQD